jgi:hypothetical protein
MTKLLSVLFPGLLALAPALGWAQSERVAPEDVRALQLVDRLKEVIQRAERNRSTDRATLNALKDLVNRYDWPWRVKLLSDDFSDGNFTANPAWSVSGGEFRVVRGAGLVSAGNVETVGSTTPTDSGTGTGSPSVIDGILGGILKGVTERGPSTQVRPDILVSEISTPVGIGNAFAIRLRMASRERNPAGSRIEFGPYRGLERDWGYRLAFNSVQKPAWELVRLSPGRSAIIGKFEGTASAGDGKVHNLEWRRERDGNMQVLVDGKELFRALDRGTDLFDGFTIVNSGGEYNFERIEIFGIN